MKNSKVKSLEKLDVVKHNDLIQADWLDDFTLFDQQFISACISQISMDDEDFEDTIIDAKELFKRINGYELRGEKRELYYKNLLLLMKKRIRIKSKLTPHGEHTFVWFTHVYNDDETGEMKVTFNQSLKKFLLNLDGDFSKTKFIRHLNSKKSFGLKIYQVMNRLSSPAMEKKFKISEIKEMLNLQGVYSRIYDFKKYVIDPAIEDINSFAEFTLTYEQQKVGRKVVYIKFIKHNRESLDEHKPVDFMKGH